MYDSNLANLLNGYTKIPDNEDVKREGEPEPKLKLGQSPINIANENTVYKNRLPSDKDADLRDALSYLIAQKADAGEARKYLGHLAFSLGDTDKTGAIKDPQTYATARNLIDKVVAFNNRPDMIQKLPKDRIMSFFDIYKNDKNVGDVVDRIRNFGTGVGANYDDSNIVGLGKYPNVPDNKVDNSITQTIQNRISKKLTPSAN